jgi:PAAR motif
MGYRRYYLVEGDKTTAGGVVLEGSHCFSIHGKTASFDTARVWCPACKSEGRIARAGPRRPFTLINKQQIAMWVIGASVSATRRPACLPALRVM